MNRKWTERFLALAEHVAQWSKDPSTKVGAVIVDYERRVISVGYNGFPRGVLDSSERYDEKSVKYKLVVHAEANAILNALISVDSKIMITTRYPCSECAKLIAQSGITELYSPPPPIDGHWAEDAEFSSMIFNEVGVSVHDI